MNWFEGDSQASFARQRGGARTQNSPLSEDACTTMTGSIDVGTSSFCSQLAENAFFGAKLGVLRCQLAVNRYRRRIYHVCARQNSGNFAFMLPRW
jgi:hypothetical protein